MLKQTLIGMSKKDIMALYDVLAYETFKIKDRPNEETRKLLHEVIDEIIKRDMIGELN